MTLYRVSLLLNQRELISYLDANGSADLKVEVVPERQELQPEAEASHKTPRTERRKRRTKAEMAAAEASA